MCSINRRKVEQSVKCCVAYLLCGPLVRGCGKELWALEQSLGNYDSCVAREGRVRDAVGV